MLGMKPNLAPWPSIPAMLSQNFVKYASREAVVDDDVRLTYKKLGRLVDDAASALSAHDVSRGDRVVIWGPNSWQWIVAALAIWRVGAVLVPLSTRLKPMELAPILRQSRCRMAFSARDGRGADLPSMLQNVEHQHDRNSGTSGFYPGQCVLFSQGEDTSPSRLTWDAFIQSGRRSEASICPAVDERDSCEIVFTSGSTDKPKGVMLSHGQVIDSCWTLTKLRGRTPEDRQLATSPFGHVLGLHACLLYSLVTGGALIISAATRPDMMLAQIKRERVSVLSGPPAMFERLMSESADAIGALENLRLIALIGAPAKARSVQRLKKFAGNADIFIGYGMTEFLAITSTRKTDPIEVVASTVGRAVNGTEILIMGGDGNQVPAGHVGEIWVRGRYAMQGYLDDRKATEAKFSDDGWLKTGDLGLIASDGNLQIVGRQKEMYISFGFNVYPSEVESLLMKSDLLDEIAIVPRSNALAGEEGVAFVVPKTGIDFNARSLLRWARKNIADYKVPRSVIEIEALPLNPAGKVCKKTLKQRLAADDAL